MPNRIVAAVERMEKQIAKRIADGLTTAEKVAGTRAAMDMDFEEYVRFQEIKSLAFATGIITLDEAQTIYSYLGESLETFNNQPVAVKVVLTQFFQELLALRVIGKL